MNGSDTLGQSCISSYFIGSTGDMKRQGDASPSVPAEKKSQDAERKRRERREAAHKRSSATIDYLVTTHAPVSMVTLTFPGDKPVPPVEEWRGMFHRWSEVMRYHGLCSWTYAVPHTHSTGGRNADVHVLCDMPPAVVTRLANVGGSNAGGQLHNLRTTNLGPNQRCLEEITLAAGFGKHIHWRVADAGASPYLLGEQWQLGRVWRSGKWTDLSETAGDP
jgi:hypothetical protein